MTDMERRAGDVVVTRTRRAMVAGGAVSLILAASLVAPTSAAPAPDALGIGIGTGPLTIVLNTPLDRHGNPVPRPVRQPTFPRPPRPAPPRPGEVMTAGVTMDQVKRQAEKAQGEDPDKPSPGSMCAGAAGKKEPPGCASGMAGHDHNAMAGGDRAQGTAAEPPAVASAAAAALPTAAGGRWTVGPTQPSATIHSVVLNTGKVLLIAGSSNQYPKFAAGEFSTTLWDPTNNTFKAIATPYDMFCAGHVILRDGRVLVAGGTTAYPVYDTAGNLLRDWKGSTKSYIFDPIKEIYEPTGDLNIARWYPSLTRLGDDRVIATSGLDGGSETRGGLDTPLNEIFTPTPGSTWDVFKGGTWSMLNERAFPQYAQMILTDDGNLFYTGGSTGNTGQMPGVWNPFANTFTEVPGLPFRWQRNASGSVLLPPAQDQKVLTFGGGDYELPALNDSNIVYLNDAAPAYRPGPPIATAKMYVGAVVLPDYTVLQTNGSARFRENAVKDAQIYKPSTNTWTTVNPPSIDRLYHSTAFLLPDGRVATAGSQVLDGANEMRIEIFEPPYMFKGTRPQITSGPTYINYDQAARFTWTVTAAPGSTISKLSLVRPSATTHSTDTEQRLVDLPFTVAPGGVTAVVPNNRNLAPPGWYMLTATDTQGRPSAAKWVSLN